MSRLETLVTVASWEDRFALGFGRTLQEHALKVVYLYHFGEYASWTEEARSQVKKLCDERDIEVRTAELRFSDPVMAWHRLQTDLASPDFTEREVLVDLSTMPRDTIWCAFWFLQQAGARVWYVYHKPRRYGGGWLSRDPDRPRLAFKLSGLAAFGRPTVLLVLTGFDRQRTEQLIRFYEPKNTLLGVQEGSDFDNQIFNLKKHQERFGKEAAVELFAVDAYSPDHGRIVVEAQIEKYLDDANIVMSSLGPKLSAVALYKIQRTHPQIALAYAPSREFSRDYSHGIGDSIVGRL